MSLQISLVRRWFTDISTIGDLLAPGFVGYALEDPVLAGPKVPGATAIPAGRYRVEITWSPRFGRFMPILLDVPHFTGIRIHEGNVAADTNGCILVGMRRAENRVLDSRKAYQRLLTIIRAADETWLTITEHRASPPMPVRAPGCSRGPRLRGDLG